MSNNNSRMSTEDDNEGNSSDIMFTQFVASSSDVHDSLLSQLQNASPFSPSSFGESGDPILSSLVNNYSSVPCIKQGSPVMQDGVPVFNGKDYYNGMDMLNESFLIGNAGQSVSNGVSSINMLKQTSRDGEVIWQGGQSSDTEGNYEECSRKVLKATRDSDAASSAMVHMKTSNIMGINESPFDVSSATSTTQFVVTNFSATVPSLFAFPSNGAISSDNNSSTAAAISSEVKVSEDHCLNDELMKPLYDELRERSLSTSCPAKVQGYELRILNQPEEQHRARYMTEGSRGAIKDRTQKDHPRVKLLGYTRNTPLQLQVFIGSDSGKVRPHSFYQACRVFGKNSTPCVERQQDGTTVVELELDPKEDMTACIDCVGILKLRNVDVERRVGATRSRKKSNRVRMVFRVLVPVDDEGGMQMLQTVSTPICCSQPSGRPEISRISLSSFAACGGHELFIIGKNFTKGTEVIFQYTSGKEESVWSASAEVDEEFLQPTHIICKIPPYCNISISAPVEVDVIVKCAGRVSESVAFVYTPCVDVNQFGMKKRPSNDQLQLLQQQQHQSFASAIVKTTINRVESQGHLQASHPSSSATVTNENVEHGVKRAFSPTGGTIVRTSINDVTPQFVGLKIGAEESMKRALKQIIVENENKEMPSVQQHDEILKRNKSHSDAIAASAQNTNMVKLASSEQTGQVGALLTSLQTLKPDQFESLLALLSIVKQQQAPLEEVQSDCTASQLNSNKAVASPVQNSTSVSGGLSRVTSVGSGLNNQLSVSNSHSPQQQVQQQQSSVSINSNIHHVPSIPTGLANLHLQLQQHQQQSSSVPVNQGIQHQISVPAGPANNLQQQLQHQQHIKQIASLGTPQQLQASKQQATSPPYQTSQSLHDHRYVSFSVPPSLKSPLLPQAMPFPSSTDHRISGAPVKQNSSDQSPSFIATMAYPGPPNTLTATFLPSELQWATVRRVLPENNAASIDWQQAQQQIPVVFANDWITQAQLSQAATAQTATQFYNDWQQQPTTVPSPASEVTVCSPTQSQLIAMHPSGATVSIGPPAVHHDKVAQPKLPPSSSLPSLAAADKVIMKDCRQELVNLVTQTKTGTDQHGIKAKAVAGNGLVSFASIVQDKVDGEDNLTMITGEDVQNCLKTNASSNQYYVLSEDASLQLASGPFQSAEIFQPEMDGVVQDSLGDDMMSFLASESVADANDSLEPTDYIPHLQTGNVQIGQHQDIFYNQAVL